MVGPICKLMTVQLWLLVIRVCSCIEIALNLIIFINLFFESLLTREILLFFHKYFFLFAFERLKVLQKKKFFSLNYYIFQNERNILNRAPLYTAKLLPLSFRSSSSYYSGINSKPHALNQPLFNVSYFRVLFTRPHLSIKTFLFGRWLIICSSYK